MALLDRFRTHPGHKNPDAAARLQFVQELPLDERELLSEVAREDADPRVRRAAVAKLMDPAALAGVAKSDADEHVRAQALTMLRDIALEAFEGARRSRKHGRGRRRSTTPKTLIGVAKNASREATALARAGAGHRRACARLDRPPRRARRRCAAPRSTACRDHAELLSIALNSEFKDPTLAAVERITDRARARADRGAREEQERGQARARDGRARSTSASPPK